MDFDVVVVGGGPAGLAAAGWLGRHRRKTVLVDSGEYRNRWVDEVHGFLGNDPITPADLRKRAWQDFEQYPDVELLAGRVVDARRREGGEFLVDVNGRWITSRRLVVATGVQDVFPSVERFFEFYGRDVFNCPTCDGFQARDQSVAVFGWGDHVAGFAVQLLDWARDVCIVANGRSLEVEEHVRKSLADHGISIVEADAVALEGRRGALEGVRLAGGHIIRCTMAFFSIEHRPVTALPETLGCEIDAEGYVRVNDEGETTVAGVYAAGDVTPGMQLAAVAAGAGTVAGVACAMSLRGEPALPGVPRPAPRPEDVQ